MRGWLNSLRKCALKTRLYGMMMERERRGRKEEKIEISIHVK